MSKHDISAILAALDPLTVLPQWLPGGQKRGGEWVAANPRRSDRTAGSFSVNITRGVWSDFASGDKGSDLISLYAYLFCNDNQGDAIKELAANNGIKAGVEHAPQDKVARIEDAQPTPIIPVPDGTPAATFKHPSHGEATRTWEYRDGEGRLMFYICRLEPADGSRKQFSPRSWCDHPGKAARWTWRGITGKAKRPLYGLDRLAAMPEADVILVEGEKAADAGQELMGETAVVVSWMGGVESASKVDLAPLAGRRVILFPDFDAQREKLTDDDEADAEKPLLPMHLQPGMRAMMAHANGLKGIASEIIMVGYQIDPNCAGWDLADAQEAGWTGQKVLRYIGKNAGDPEHIASGKAQAAPAAPANDNQPAPQPEGVPLNLQCNPFDFPDKTDKGPMNTVENMEYLLGEYAISARYNQVRKAVELVMPGRSYTLDNRANCSLAELNSICVRNRMSASNLQEYVKLLADKNAYNPVCDWITSKPWDGIERVQQLLDTVHTEGDAGLKNKLMYRWLLSAVAAVFLPHGFEGHGCLVFTGPQGIGKTTWFRRLVPAELRLVLTGAMLDPSDKDTVTNAVSHWIVELGELDATFRKADIARLKSFIPKAEDKLRRPYDRIDSEYQRRTVFGASVNDDRYLVDDTGNRRWWTIVAVWIDYNHDIDMQQLWAELLTHFKAGAQWHLTKEENEALGELNADHEAIDPVEEMILSAFAWDDAIRTQRLTASQVLIAVGFDKPNKAQATHASKVLKKLTGGDPKKSGSVRYFEMPARIGRQSRDDDDRPF